MAPAVQRRVSHAKTLLSDTRRSAPAVLSHQRAQRWQSAFFPASVAAAVIACLSLWPLCCAAEENDGPLTIHGEPAQLLFRLVAVFGTPSVLDAMDPLAIVSVHASPSSQEPQGPR